MYNFNFVFLIAASIIGLALVLFFVTRAGRYREKEMEGSLEFTLDAFYEIIEPLTNPFILLACVMIFSTMLKDSGLVATIIPLYATSKLGIDVSRIGILMASRTVGVAFGTISGGYLSDRLGRLRVLLLALLIATLSVFVMPIAKDAVQLSPMIGINGISYG